MNRAFVVVLCCACGATQPSTPTPRLPGEGVPGLQPVARAGDSGVDPDGGPWELVADADGGGVDAGPIDPEPDAGCGSGNPTYVDGGDLWANTCAQALQSDLPMSGGLLPDSSATACPASAPTPGATCAASGTSCSYGSLQPGCFNREYQCSAGRWVEGLHTDPNAPWTLTQCQQGLTLPSGCPAPSSAFFTRSGQACGLPAGTVCDYGNGGARCVQFALSCDGAAWHRLPDEAWGYCNCTRIEQADAG